jgi:hypothetical protein
MLTSKSLERKSASVFWIPQTTDRPSLEAKPR